MATTGTFGYRVEGREGAVKIEGLNKVRRDLKKLASDVDYGSQFLAVNKTLADAVARDSENYVPYRTGALSASIRAAASQKSARVKVGGRLSKEVRSVLGGYGVGKGSVQYAGPIHFGWPARFIKPQPFIYDAVDKRRKEIAERYAELITKLIKTNDLNP
jgi:hypothetical protein